MLSDARFDGIADFFGERQQYSIVEAEAQLPLPVPKSDAVYASLVKRAVKLAKRAELRSGFQGYLGPVD
ncbi:hypothetical protein [Paraburkholderia sp. 32]|uniref:hypothetical protein n=1 Tax=Paraburkholderia sp. 32 TaxID=2991057 RepID=UPI003D21002D